VAFGEAPDQERAGGDFLVVVVRVCVGRGGDLLGEKDSRI